MLANTAIKLIAYLFHHLFSCPTDGTIENTMKYLLNFFIVNPIKVIGGSSMLYHLSYHYNLKNLRVFKFDLPDNPDKCIKW